METADVLELENQEIYLVRVDRRQQIGVNLLPKGAKQGKETLKASGRCGLPACGLKFFNASPALSKSLGHAQGWN